MLVIGCVVAAFWYCVLFWISIDVCGWMGAAKGDVCLLLWKRALGGVVTMMGRGMVGLMLLGIKMTRRAFYRLYIPLDFAWTAQFS